MKSKYSACERLQLIKEYKSSGKTIAVFAEENHINRNTFAYWLSTNRLQTQKTIEEGNFIEVKTSVLQKNEQTIQIRKGELEIIIPMSTAPSYLKNILEAVSAL